MKKIIIAILVSVLILFGIANFYLWFQENKPKDWFLDEGAVRGSGVVHKEQIYTLNFDQQNALLEILNESKRVKDKTVKSSESSGIDNLVIYLFHPSEPVVLTPINAAYSLFSVSTFKPNRYLAIGNSEKLQALLNTTYDWSPSR